MKASVMYMLLLATAIGVATFIENDYGTQSAKALVYKTHWFEGLWALFVFSVVSNIVRYKMYRRDKWGQLVLHLAFILIAVGALVTRYIGYEGVLHLRNGQESRTMVSDHMVLNIILGQGEDRVGYFFPMYLSSLGTNHFSQTLTHGNETVQIDLERYLPSAHRKGERFVTGALKPGGRDPQLITLNITANGANKTVDLTGFKSTAGTEKSLSVGGVAMQLSYGAKVIALPFVVKLDRFVLARYPGSMMPSSYESYITVNDLERNATIPYHIYMNHVLSYRGYRFFQSSYDTDEQGSILSVNHDPGALPTYAGYLLLLIGFLWSFVSRLGRLKHLKKRLAKLKNTGAAAALIMSIVLAGTAPMHAEEVDLSLIHKIDLKHAEAFGQLPVQGFGGRIKPMDTQAREILSKITHSQSWDGLSADQMMLGMMARPDRFQKVRMIRVDHPAIIKKLGLSRGAHFASYDDMFSQDGKYRFASDVQAASRKAPGEQGTYDREILRVDERLNVLYQVFQGSYLRIFPKPKDAAHRWAAPAEALKTFPPKIGEMVRLFVSNYFQNINEAIQSGDWDKADTALDMIKKYQRFYDADILPSPARLQGEAWYNKLNLFIWLILVYMMTGFATLILSLVMIIKPAFQPRRSMGILVAALTVGLLVHTFGMALRWYVSGHAPWSGSYESLLYIAWTIVFAGFFFVKKSPLTMAATSIMGGIFLGAAWLSNMDPQITNLVPVLKSYWLTIHVAIITASYGFLGLSALLALVVLLLIIFYGIRKEANVLRSIKELTYINETSLLIGVFLLTIGNFLGGIWANESWGRYWGWDPKEAWTAVSILVYASVAHLRFWPKFNTIYAYTVASLLAISTVVMTYFGVNYYLSGLHSYAGGDPVPLPSWVPPSLLVMFVVILWAGRYRKEIR